MTNLIRKLFEPPEYYLNKTVDFISEDKNLNRIGILLICLACIFYIFSDYLIFNCSSVFFIVLYTRIIVILFSIYTIFYIKFSKDDRLYSFIIFIWTLLLIIMIFIAEFYRPEEYLTDLHVQNLVVFLIFLVIRNKLLLQIIPAFILSCSILIELFLFKNVEFIQTYLAFIIPLFGINYFGIFFALRLKSYRLNIIKIIQSENELRNELKSMAFSDTLTGIHNRRMILNIFSTEFHHVKRYGTSLSIIMLDIDFFKDINDEFGHYTGDLVLVEVSKILLKIIRDNDQLGRIGGEEFLILLPHTKIGNAVHLAKRIKNTLNSTIIKIDNIDVSVTASMGLAEVLKNDKDIDSSLARDDRNMYKVKKSGRNNFRYM